MIVVVTGASGGIGFELARALQERGCRIVVVGRDRARHGGLLLDKDDFVECELTRLASVATAAKTVRHRFPQVDLLINNAGAGGKRGVTEDGFELAFAVNYLSHYLLTRVLDRPARIVNVSSEAHRGVKALDPSRGLGRTKTLLGWKEYQFSKAAQVAFTTSLASRGFDAYSAHPGVTATELWRSVPVPIRTLVTRRMQPPAAGAIPVMRAGTDASLQAGDYVTPSGVVPPNPICTDPEVAERLWNQSEEWVAAYLH